MSDAIHLDGKEYISSRRASELSGYAQDYIGQLARGAYIDARRVGGLWYISMSSLESYKERAETYKPQAPERRLMTDPDSLISFDGKDYISASRASKISGYHQDYVGQLARSGTILSRQVGNRWYVEREAIIMHKNEKDSLLGAVQAESVGIRRSVRDVRDRSSTEANHAYAGAYLTYTRDDGELFPTLGKKDKTSERSREFPDGLGEDATEPVPIRIVQSRKTLDHKEHVKHVKSVVRTHGKTMFYGTLAASALTIVIVLSFGFSTLKNQSTYAANIKKDGSLLQRSALTAGASEAFNALEGMLESWVVPELIYKRRQ